MEVNCLELADTHELQGGSSLTLDQRWFEAGGHRCHCRHSRRVAAGRLLRALLFGITATDPFTFVWVSLTLVLVTVAPCYVPARRALKIDPVHALRVD